MGESGPWMQEVPPGGWGSKQGKSPPPPHALLLSLRSPRGEDSCPEIKGQLACKEEIYTRFVLLDFQVE